MSHALIQQLWHDLEQIELIDPHTHINPHAPASKTLADILGYHYYTELAHSAGCPREAIEEPGISPKEKVRRLVPYFAHLDNTIQMDWFLDIARSFFGFTGDHLTEDNWEPFYDHVETVLARPGWEDEVLKRSRISKVFLTNDFDDPLTGFDTDRYIPCLRTDDLVFHLSRPDTLQRLNKATDTDVRSIADLKSALGRLFTHFTSHGAKACAISLPPDFEPQPISDSEAEPVLQAILAGRELTIDERKTISCAVFWRLAEYCADFGLPFDLMIGVNRRVYEAGVYQGQDLFDQRTSLILYRKLFNAFPQVKFPISVLASVSNQELVSYCWIFPNVIAHGHWWYSNIPPYIEIDCRSRLQAAPRNKQIGYYSDMYKLEFALPKFRMYRKALAKTLVEDFVIARGWTEERALALGKQTLRGNVETIFNVS
ncbi:MAG: glucuronate isomerase [Planctomycetota bacterium]|nr:glucuronate isomerase [Planctomycetota bacterium]MDA1212807.1 glucuronate isomerase [Planctomycetota bacterium]